MNLIVEKATQLTTQRENENKNAGEGNHILFDPSPICTTYSLVSGLSSEFRFRTLMFSLKYLPCTNRILLFVIKLIGCIAFKQKRIDSSSSTVEKRGTPSMHFPQWVTFEHVHCTIWNSLMWDNFFWTSPVTSLHKNTCLQHSLAQRRRCPWVAEKNLKIHYCLMQALTKI